MITLRELAAGVEEKEFAFAVGGLGIVEKENNARRGGVVEKIFRQVDNAFDQVLLDEPFAHVFFFVRIGVAGAARSGAGVENDGGAAVVV